MHTNMPTRRADVKDPIGITGWPKEEGRDGERTPMQWTPGPQAGFSTNPQTWLPVAPDYKTVNVQTESGEAESLLEWNEKLIALRRENMALHDGGLTMLDSGPNVLAYVRRAAGAPTVMVVMNVSAAEVAAPVNGTAKTLAESEAGIRVENGRVVLPAYASWVGEVR
jgi:alpha-glucosidase